MDFLGVKNLDSDFRNGKPGLLRGGGNVGSPRCRSNFPEFVSSTLDTVDDTLSKSHAERLPVSLNHHFSFAETARSQ